MKKTGPDSLGSWVIAVACCFINMILFGFSRLSGVLFVASAPRFGVNRQKASFPYTLASFMRNASGPFVGLLSHRFGVRTVTTLGCIVGAAGVGGCFFAEDINAVTVLWGWIFGVGFGLGNVLLPLSINQYFDKHRATASGISFSGASLGSLLLPPILEILLNTYGLSGTYLILCGLILNCVPAALLLVQPRFKIKTLQNGDQKKRLGRANEEMKNSTRETAVADLQPQKVLENREQKLRSEEGCLNHGYEGEIQFSPESRSDKEVGVHLYKVDGRNQADLKWKETKRPHNFESSEDMENAPVKAERHQVSQKKSTSFHDVCAIILDPMFNLIAITSAIYCLTFVCMFTVIVDFARDLDVQESSEKYILMCASVGDLIGRLGLGWVTDKGYMTPNGFTALLFACQGVSIAAIAWSDGFLTLLLLVAFYGLAEAGIIVLMPIIMAQNMDHDQQMIAIPSSVFLSGPVCLAVSPLIGYFRDNLGSYKPLFYLIALMSFVCCFLWMPCISLRNRKRRGVTLEQQ